MRVHPRTRSPTTARYLCVDWGYAGCASAVTTEDPAGAYLTLEEGHGTCWDVASSGTGGCSDSLRSLLPEGNYYQCLCREF